MSDTINAGKTQYTTNQVATAAGCSVQQVRNLEQLGVIPPAVRRPNGYRRFTRRHLTAVCTYRHLAVAVGPVVARTTMRDLWKLPPDEAVARVVGLHADLARSRDRTVAALRALDSIVDESAHETAGEPEDAMSITELASALGVRSSALRFWEQQGLITPQRSHPRGSRRYPPAAVRDARIVVELRAGGYRIPAVQAVVASLRTWNGTATARDALQERLRRIADRSVALLRAGSDIVALVDAAVIPPLTDR